MRKKLIDRRLGVLEAALEGLTVDERRLLGELMAKVLTNVPQSEMAKHRICRLCAVQLCTDCPIPGNAI